MVEAIIGRTIISSKVTSIEDDVEILVINRGKFIICLDFVLFLFLLCLNFELTYILNILLNDLWADACIIPSVI